MRLTTICALAALLLLGCPGNCPPADQAPPAIAAANLALGDPCSATSDCASGLTCEAAPADRSSVCTSDCSSAPCPAAAACVTWRRYLVDENANGCAGGCQVVPVDVSNCFPGCATDADCQTSLRAGVCSATTGTCTPLGCFADQDCPGGYSCFAASFACCEALSCPVATDTPGWCRRT